MHLQLRQDAELVGQEVWVTWQNWEISHLPVFSNQSVCLEVKPLWPHLRGGRRKGQPVDHYPLRGSRHGRTCFPLYHGPLAKPTVLWGCRTSVLHSLHVTLILEDFYLTDRNFVVAGVAHTGWLFLWPLLGYYIYYMVGCVCRQPTQWSMNCHPFLWGIIGDSSNKISAILENLGGLFPGSPVFCKSCCEFFSFPSFQRC